MKTPALAARRPLVVAALVLAGLTSCSGAPTGAGKKEEPQGEPAVTLQLTIEGGTAQDRDAIRTALAGIPCVAKVDPAAGGTMTLTLKPGEPLDLHTLEETIQAVKPDPAGKGFRFDRRTLISGGVTHFKESGHTKLKKDELVALAAAITSETGFKAEYRLEYFMNFRLTPKGAKPESLRRVFELLKSVEETRHTRFVRFTWNDPG